MPSTTIASGRLRIGRAKTDAGRCDVRLLAALRDELAALRANRPDADADACVFATARGGRPSPENIRSRILKKAIERADVRLRDAGENPLPEGLTPHGLRRTFASILYAIGESPAEVMARMGHTDPGLALRIYAAAMRRNDDEQGRLKALVEGAPWVPVGTDGATKADASSPTSAP